MYSKFIKNRDGNYAVLVALMMAPLFGAVTVAIDYTNLTRHKAATMHALDASGLATAREISDGKTDDEIKEYAKDFFQANLGPVKPKDTVLSVALPVNTEGARIIKLGAKVKYHPYFLPVFSYLLGMPLKDGAIEINGEFESRVRLKNTAEIALVLDNSGSMAYKGSGSNKTRLELLKAAAKKLVEEISGDAKKIKQLSKAAQFSVVPFASSVNIGSSHASENWMDKNGISSIHHENFDWSTLTDPNMTYEVVNGAYVKKGNGWGDSEGEKLTRFSLYQDMQRITDTIKEDWVCTKWSGHKCKEGYYATITNEYDKYAAWQGCVESRPYPWNVDDTEPKSSNPDTLFVPMFAPDEADGADAYNNWWDDDGGASWANMQENMTKYFEPAPDGTNAAKAGEGPNLSCTTQAITPLQDTTTTDGLDTITDAIDDMIAKGGTNVTEGIAWGWRSISSREPFTEGRSDNDRGNDKVIIVLTDGRNTYYTPSSLGKKDLAENKSIYSAYGYTKTGYGGTPKTRLFMGTSNDVSNAYSNSNYTVAMNEHMAAVCGNAKDQNVIIFTVGLDLDTVDDADMIEALGNCASESRIRRGEKLFWNTKGNDLENAFDSITDELSNLYIIG